MATTNEERLKILQMLEERKINAEEAATLLRAMSQGKPTTGRMLNPEGEGRYLRVRVTDRTSGKTKVNVTVPMSLVNVGLRMAERFAPDFEGVDMRGLEEALASGAIGKMVEISDEDEDELVEIYVE